MHLSCALPASTFFDFQAKGRYFITREDVEEYKRRAEIAHLQAAARQVVAAAARQAVALHLSTTPTTTLDIHQATRGNKPT